MAMKTRYTVVDGEVIAEKRSGVRKQYVPDPLGSTVALLDKTQTQTDTFTYWPYGEVRTRTGTTATPFQYVGTKGCHQDSSSRTYMRARVLDVVKGRWLPQDPIGYDGGLNLYAYVDNMPTVYIDPSGLQGDWLPPKASGCKGLNKAQCYACAYMYYFVVRDLSDEASCILANHFCHTHLNCSGGSNFPGTSPNPPLCSNQGNPTIPLGGVIGPEFPILPFTDPAPISGHQCELECDIIYRSRGVGWRVCIGMCDFVTGASCRQMTIYCEGQEREERKKLCEYLLSKLCFEQ